MNGQRSHRLRLDTEPNKSHSIKKHRVGRLSTLPSQRTQHSKNKISVHLPVLSNRPPSKSWNRRRAPPAVPQKMLLQQLRVKSQLRDIEGYCRLLINHKELWSIKCALKCIQFIGAELFKFVPGLMMAVGKLCLASGQYRDAVDVFKCALEYTWYTDQKDNELEVYDCLGVAHYYLGEIKMARLYHRRYLSGRHQPVSSSIRCRAIFKLSKRQKANPLGAFSRAFFDQIELEQRDIRLKDILRIIHTDQSRFVTRYLLCNQEDQPHRSRERLFFTHLSSNRIFRKVNLSRFEEKMEAIEQ